MKLWLDDYYSPENVGRPDWVWAKTAAEAISFLQTGEVTEASLDYNLKDWRHSGMDVVLWLEEHPEFWPPQGTVCHSSNPECNDLLWKHIRLHYCRTGIDGK